MNNKLKNQLLTKLINLKSKELTEMVVKPNKTLLDKDIYEKSCELDKLVIKYMKQAR